MSSGYSHSLRAGLLQPRGRHSCVCLGSGEASARDGSCVHLPCSVSQIPGPARSLLPHTFPKPLSGSWEFVSCSQPCSTNQGLRLLGIREAVSWKRRPKVSRKERKTGRTWEEEKSGGQGTFRGGRPKGRREEPLGIAGAEDGGEAGRGRSRRWEGLGRRRRKQSGGMGGGGGARGGRSAGPDAGGFRARLAQPGLGWRPPRSLALYGRRTRLPSPCAQRAEADDAPEMPDRDRAQPRFWGLHKPEGGDSGFFCTPKS